MNKIKDILYDKNDILIALVILLLAGFVIFARVESIMAYPSKLLAESESSGNQIRITATNNHADDQNENSAATDQNDSSTPSGLRGEPQYPYSVTINYGQSMDSIGSIFVNLGFFESVEDFHQTLAEYDASTKVQAGTFIIPVDATVEELIGIITKPGL